MSSSKPLSSPTPTTNRLSVSTDWLILTGMCINGVTQYVPFYVWLLSLNVKNNIHTHTRTQHLFVHPLMNIWVVSGNVFCTGSVKIKLRQEFSAV